MTVHFMEILCLCLCLFYVYCFYDWELESIRIVSNTTKLSKKKLTELLQETTDGCTLPMIKNIEGIFKHHIVLFTWLNTNNSKDLLYLFEIVNIVQH